MSTVAIIGGGVSGLSAAYYLAKATNASVVKKVSFCETCFSVIFLSSGIIAQHNF